MATINREFRFLNVFEPIALGPYVIRVDSLAQHVERFKRLLSSRLEKTAADNARLVESYRYLGYYYLLQNDKDTFTSYMNKILEIDPENEMAKNALGALSGGAK